MQLSIFYLELMYYLLAGGKSIRTYTMTLDLVGANGICPPYIAYRLKICVSSVYECEKAESPELPI